MDNGNPVVQPAVPQNNIPDDIVNELPMNNSTFGDVNDPGAIPPPPVDTNTGVGMTTPPSPGMDGFDGGGSAVPPPPPNDLPGTNPPAPAAMNDPLAGFDMGGPSQSGSAPAADTPTDGFGPTPAPAPARPAPNDVVPADNTTPLSVPVSVGSDDQGTDLLDIKKSALQELSPLVEHLDQPPEERFKTLLDMIRASDNTSLVRPAYTAAQLIQNEQARAKALLEIVKEVNYLTQAKDEAAPPPPA